MSDTTYGTGSTHPNSNVVLLANETQTGSIITKTAVRNSKILTLGYSSVDTENGLVGLMSYNGAYAENKLGGTIEINSKNSIGIASMGVTSGSVVASEANNEGIINVNGANSVGIYNEGTFLNIFTGLHYLFKSELDETERFFNGWGHLSGFISF